jgi:hypothetical protein
MSPKKSAEAAPNFVGYVMFAVEAEDAEAAKAQVSGEVVVVAASIRELPHPIHLAEANLAYGMIGIGGKASAEEREDG